MSERIEIPAEKLHEEMLKLRQGKHMDFYAALPEWTGAKKD